MTEAKTEARKPAARKPAAKRAETKTVIEQQLEAFTGPSGKQKAVAFFTSSLPRLISSYDHGEEAYAIIHRWDELQSTLGGAEVNLDTLGQILPDLRRFVDLVYGENARTVVNTHWDGNVMALFSEINS